MDRNVRKPFTFGRLPHDYMLSAHSMIGRMICAHADGAGGRELDPAGSGLRAISV